MANKENIMPGTLIRNEEQIRSFLEDSSKKGRNLLEHFEDVLDFLVQNYPEESLDKFEEASYLLKKNNPQLLEQFLKVSEQKTYAQNDESVTNVTQPYLDRVIPKKVTLFSIDLRFRFKLRMRRKRPNRKDLFATFKTCSPTIAKFFNGLAFHLVKM